MYAPVWLSRLLMQVLTSNIQLACSNVQLAPSAVHVHGHRVMSMHACFPAPPGVALGVIVASFEGKVIIFATSDDTLLGAGFARTLMGLVAEELDTLSGLGSEGH